MPSQQSLMNLDLDAIPSIAKTHSAFPLAAVASALQGTAAGHRHFRKVLSQLPAAVNQKVKAAADQVRGSAEDGL